MKKQLENATLKKMEENCQNVALIMKSLSHPQRLMILCHLSLNEKTVSELEDLCHISQSQISQFLSRMKLEKLITSEKRGLFVFYRIADDRTKKLISSLHKIFCE